MPTKQETIDNINPQTTYLGSYVKKMINEISDGKNIPTNYRKGMYFE